MKRLPPKAWLAIRLVLSAALLWLAFRPIDWQALVNASRQIEPVWLLLAWVLVVTSNTLAACRWGWIMHRADLHLPWTRYITLYFAAGLINQGVPSTLGGDTYRAVQATHGMRVQEGPALRYGLLTVGLDRGMGLIGNITLGAVGLILGGTMIGTWAAPAGWAVLTATVSGTLLAGLLLPLASVGRFVQRALQVTRLPHGLGALQGVFSWPVNMLQLILAVVIHLVTLATFWACLMAFGVKVPLQALMVGLPALGLLLMLPISISGWGLRETTLSAVLLLWSVPVSTTVLASISYGLIVVLAYLPSTLTLLRSRRPTVAPATTITTL